MWAACALLLPLLVQACIVEVSDAYGRRGEALQDGVSVLTQHNDNQRTGANLRERVLTTTNVTKRTFGKLFVRDLPEGVTPSAPGQLYAQPLYVANAIGGKNVVYVATERNNVYAFDADDPAAKAPLWSVNLGPALNEALPSAYGGSCQDLKPNVGITGTPVIDAATGTLYVAAKTKEIGKYYYRLHALDIVTGSERVGSPVTVAGIVDKTGAPSSNPRASGVSVFDARIQLQRPGLLLTKGSVFVAFGSHCDAGRYHGWIFGYDAANVSRPTGIYNTTPNGKGGAIWQAGGGLTADDAGNIYLLTGNGSYERPAASATMVRNLGTSFIRVSGAGTGTLTTGSWFTPYNVQSLDSRDQDLGSSGALLVPGTNLVIGGGKEGMVYVLNKESMGKYNMSGDTQIVQRFQAARSRIFGSPVYWQGPSGPHIYLWPQSTGISAFPFDGALFGAALVNATSPKPAHPGGILSLSANGSAHGTGIVWATAGASDSNHGSVPGTVYAFDAEDITHKLWDSDEVADDKLGLFAKFTPPSIVNGKVYVATQSNQLVVYGILPMPRFPDPGGVDAGSPDAGPGDVTPPPPPPQTWTTVYNAYVRVGTPGHCANSGCHGRSSNGGFSCGTTKDSCYRGLVARGLIDPADPARSWLADPDTSPLGWISPNGSMPFDAQGPNTAGRDIVLGWIYAGAKNN